MRSLERVFSRVFADWLPPLPAHVKYWAARIFPLVVIALGSLGVLAWLGVIGESGVATLQTFGISRAFPVFAAAIFHVLVPILQLLAIAGGYHMLLRRRLGWRLAFYVLLLGLFINLIWFSLAGIVWNIAFAYLLFQLKHYYPKC